MKLAMTAEQVEHFEAWHDSIFPDCDPREPSPAPVVGLVAFDINETILLQLVYGYVPDFEQDSADVEAWLYRNFKDVTIFYSSEVFEALGKQAGHATRLIPIENQRIAVELLDGRKHWVDLEEIKAAKIRRHEHDTDGTINHDGFEYWVSGEYLDRLRMQHGLRATVYGG